MSSAQIWFKSEPHEKGRKYTQLGSVSAEGNQPLTLEPTGDDRYLILDDASGEYLLYVSVPGGSGRIVNQLDGYPDLGTALEALVGEPV
jgi:hypothetical protein